MENQERDKNLLFLNTPINDESQDVIGVNIYVKKLNSAIDAGAQMIAVTSPFGSGKTSIAELLEQKRNYLDKREKIIKISMWTQFHGDNKDGSTSDLHRSFVYQLTSQINHKRGTYINRRLSPNYGLLKLHANKTRYWILFMVAILLLILSWGIHTYPEQITLLFPFLKNNIDSWVTGISFIGVVLGVIIITRAEMIFSTKKAEGKREIESAEIIDIYREEILKYKGKRNRYIVIIEDLDRTTDAKAVIGFLKELRKYYVPEKNTFKSDTTYRNKVVFVVNVKPEALLMNQMTDKEMDSLYAKLFDYILNLQTINIDNYDSILEGLLKEKIESIKDLGFPTEGNLSELPGMKWIIRERRLGIREIKERLNIAFTLYESLTNKFQSSAITFEKCAVVAFLTTAFEQDFYNTDDRAFEKLVNLFLQNLLTNENCTQYLEGASSDYVSTVQELITAKLIDSSYRTYFYNYPQGSFLYSSDESQLINAILYAEHINDLDQIAQRVIASSSSAPQRAFQTLEQLGLMLPQTVFQSETLYIEAIKQAEKKFFHYIDCLDYSSESVTKTIAFFRKILIYDKDRKVFNKDYADKLCKIWEAHFSETALLQLRSILCKEFSSEIMWYKPLFYGVHALIRTEELDSCTLIDAISLINLDNEEFSVSLAKYIQLRFSKQQTTIETEESNNVEGFLRSLRVYFEPELIVPLYLGFMDTVCQIIPDFEKEIFDFIKNGNFDEKVKDNTFILYQDIINKTVESLTIQTIKYICSMDRYNGFNHDVAVHVYKNEYYFDYTLLLLHQNTTISFEQIEIKKALENDINWLISHKEYFLPLRNQLTKCQEDVLLQYTFMFDVNCPVMTNEELFNIQSNIESSEQIVMKLILAEMVTEENYEMLSNYFNQKKQTNNLTFEILMYISTFSPEISKLCFYTLDFNMIRYRYIAANKKSIIKHTYFDILNLDLPTEKIYFMKSTKYLDTSWDNELLDSLKSDSDLQKSYIEVVNNSETITKNTIQTLCKLGTLYAMSALVNQKLLEYKKYTEYVVSVSMLNSRFDIAEGESKTELWPTYIKIFSSSAYRITRKYMSLNPDFLRCVMSEKLYQGFAEDNRMQLNGIYQDSDSIMNIIEYKINFALQYYTSMKGFLNEAAASTFVTIVENNSELIASDELYNHTHDMLINGKLKARYTNVRKKHGYGK